MRTGLKSTADKQHLKRSEPELVFPLVSKFETCIKVEHIAGESSFTCYSELVRVSSLWLPLLGHTHPFFSALF